MKKITEHTNGSHIYMKMELDGKEHEIDVFLDRNGRESYRTDADGNPETREAIIRAFNRLY